jgi:hypothetical protein
VQTFDLWPNATAKFHHREKSLSALINGLEILSIKGMLKLDPFLQCLDRWRNATVDFHYREKLLSAPTNRLEIPSIKGLLHKVNPFLQCLDLWPNATMKFHYMHMLLSAPNNGCSETPTIKRLLLKTRSLLAVLGLVAECDSEVPLHGKAAVGPQQPRVRGAPSPQHGIGCAQGRPRKAGAPVPQIREHADPPGK